MSSKHEL